ncbi:MAG: serine protease [Saprospiraceae bacterium]
MIRNLIFGLLLPIQLFSQNIEIKGSAIGTIKINGVHEGSAFVAGTDRTVITCSHVIQDFKEIYYQDMDVRDTHKLTVIYNDKERDFAILLGENQITTKPLKLGVPNKFPLGHKVMYLGYDVRESKIDITFRYDFGYITCIGTSFSVYGNSPVDFFEYEGIAIGGFSGGPVFDLTNNCVIGIITELYKVIDSKGNIRHFNRAFTINEIDRLFNGR